MPRKVRLDLHMLTEGLVDSRQQAQNLIRAGKVSDSFGKILDKPGQEVSRDLVLQIKRGPKFVSRGGEKLLAALETFPIKVKDRICIDGGISTGGFTDCLLQHGAALVYGIDVGYGQTAWTLRNDPRVVLKERTNIRYLTPEDLYRSPNQKATLAVADLSFISLKITLPAIKSLLEERKSEALLLIKPQFEVGKGRVSKGGVVKEFDAHVDAINSVMDFALLEGWKIKGLLASPLTGPAGNHEYLLWLGMDGLQQALNVEELVKKTIY